MSSSTMRGVGRRLLCSAASAELHSFPGHPGELTPAWLLSRLVAAGTAAPDAAIT